MARQDQTIRLLPALSALPAAGANTGAFLRYGGHVYFDTGTAIVQVDQQALLAALSSTVPPTPVDGTTLALFDLNQARPEVARLDFSGFPQGLGIAEHDVMRTCVSAGAAGPSSIGSVAFSQSGTGTSYTPVYGATAFSNVCCRINAIPTSAAANSIGYSKQSANSYQVGNPAITNAGGFFFAAKMMLGVTPAGCSVFVGLIPYPQAISGTVSASLNIAGFGFDSTDSSWSFMVNNGSGTATKTAIPTSLTGAIVSNTFGNTPVLDFRMYSPPGIAAIYWFVKSLSSPSNPPVSGVATTKLPASVLSAAMMIDTVANASACSLGLIKMVIETAG